jgi:hypothetical protein
MLSCPLSSTRKPGTQAQVASLGVALFLSASHTSEMLLFCVLIQGLPVAPPDGC